jgi:hypothetical protein
MGLLSLVIADETFLSRMSDGGLQVVIDNALQGAVMNRGIRYVTTRLMAGVVISGMVFSVSAFAGNTACGKPMTEAQKVQRALDIAEIQNVASAHEYYHGVWDHQGEIDNIWSKRDDISWKNNTDYYKGRKDTLRFYVENAKSLSKVGVLAYHMLTTPMIEVAGDGETARGIWMSFGNVSGKMGATASAVWTEEKYSMDFIKENGDWKIWHLRTYVEFYSPTNGSWLDEGSNLDAPKNTGQEQGGQAGAGAPPQGAGAPPQGAGAPPSGGQAGAGAPPQGNQNQAGVKEEPGSKFDNDLSRPTEKGNYYEGYTLKRAPIFDPKPPVAYCHYSELKPF